MADNVVEIIIRAIDQMSGTLDKIGKSGGDLQTKLVANWKAIGLAAAAAGAGLELLARQQGELSRQTDQAAITTGMTSAEVNQLARDVADASTSIEEALDLISLAGKEGLKSGEEIKAYAEFWDMVSDASGEAAEELAGASDGLEHFGISAKNSSEAADAFGHILNNTKTSISEFLGIANKVGPSLDKFDLSINDLALMVDQLEEAGYTGKQAIKAINEAAAGAGSFEAFVSNLEKATGAQIDFNRSLSGSAEKLAAQAAAVDKNVTPIQRLTSAWNEFMYSNGRFIQQAAVMVPALASIGPLLKGIQTVSLASSVSIAGMTVTVGGLLTVLGPLAIALAGVAAVWILNKDNVEEAMESYKGGTSAIKEMDQAARDAIPSLREFADAQKEAAEAGKYIENVFKYSTKTVYEYGGAYTAQGIVVGTTAQQIAQAEKEIALSRERTSKDIIASIESERAAYQQMVADLQAAGVSTQQAAEIASAAFPQIATSAEGMSGRTAAALKAVESALNDGVITAGQAEAMYKSIFENIGNAAGNMAAKIQEFVRDTKGAWQGLQEIYTIQGKNAGEGAYYWWNEKTGIWEHMVPAADGQGFVPIGSKGATGGAGGKGSTGGGSSPSGYTPYDPNANAPAGHHYDPLRETYVPDSDDSGWGSPSQDTEYYDNEDRPDWAKELVEEYYASQAAGGGRIKKGGKLTVGEEGPEVYQKPDGTFILVGKDGEEEIVVEEGGKILPLPGKSWQAFEEKSRSGTGEGSAEMDPLMESIDVHQKMRDSISEETETARTRLDSIDELIEATLKQHKQNADLTGSLFGSSDATKAHGSSLMDLIRKYQETDGAVGDSQKNLDHWNTSVVGNTEKMSKETLGSVEGMSSGVRAGAGRTTRDISETWNQIGKDSEEGTAGLGNDWKSFLQSARRDLQTEVQACSGPGCGFTGGGTGDGTGTGLEPVYDLEELWRRRGLPRAARGAKIVGAGDILVGEERPEVVRLPQGASVHPLSEYDGGFGGRAGNVYQITINTQGVIGDKSTARQFARWIMEALDFETIRRGTVA